MSINGNQNCKTRIDFHLFSKLFKIVASSSDRFLEIEDCEECCGHGKQEKYQKRTCPLCEGEGWFEDSKGLIMVCDLCHGFKSLNEPFFTDCPKCDSKGKKVYLMQKFLVEAPCDDCIGTGIRYSKCNECDGKGHSFQKLSVTNWNSTNEAKKMTILHGPDYLLEMEESDSFLLENGRELKIKKCHNCSKSRRINCFLCNGKKILFVLLSESDSCVYCSNSGKVNIDYNDYSYYDKYTKYESKNTFQDEEIDWDEDYEDNEDYEDYEDYEDVDDGDADDYENNYENDEPDDNNDEYNSLLCESCMGRGIKIKKISLVV